VARKKRRRGRNLDLMALTVGPTAANVRSQVSREQWKKLVKAAHRQGFAVDSFLNPDIPRPLKERTGKSLRAEAKKTILEAYKPAEQELTDREKKIKALDAKRASDNAYYNDWLKTRSDQLIENQKTAKAAHDARQAEIQRQLGTQLEAGKHAAAKAAGGHAGVVSDPSQSTALANSGEADRASKNVAGAVGLAEQQSHTNEGHLAATAANNFAIVAAEEARRIAQTWEGLKDVADDKQKVQLSKAADTAKEVARLLDGEVGKANSNREAYLAGAVLDVKGKELDLKALTQRQKNQRSKEKNQLTAQQQAEQQRHNLVLEDLDREARELSRTEFTAKYGRSPAEWLSMSPAQRAAWLKKYNASNGKGKKGRNRAHSDDAIRTGRRDLRKVEALVTDELNLDPSAQGGSILEVLAQDPKGPKLDPLMVEAAYQRKRYGGVSAKTRKAFHRAYGIWLPLSRSERSKKRR
jgi:hypothetical protein